MRRVIYAAAVLFLSACGALAVAAPASAVVLVNQPAASVCVGHSFKVGVWYQPSGGPRSYRLDVYNPQGTRVLAKRGKAPTANWRFWHVVTTMLGKYHTVYRVIVNGTWKPYRVATRVRHC